MGESGYTRVTGNLWYDVELFTSEGGDTTEIVTSSIDWLFKLITPSELDTKVKLAQVYGWLLSGIVTGLLVWFLNSRKDSHNYRNIAHLIADELDINYYLLTQIAKGASPEKCKFQSESWDKVKYDAAKFLPQKIFAAINLIHRHLAMINRDPQTLGPDDLHQCTQLSRFALEYLQKFSGSELPDINAKSQDYTQ